MKSLDGLAEDYIKFCSEHGEATLIGDSKKANRNYSKIIGTVEKIKKFENGRKALYELMINSDNRSVKIWAASELIDFSKEEAISTLREQAKGSDILAFNARMILKTRTGGE